MIARGIIWMEVGKSVMLVLEPFLPVEPPKPRNGWLIDS